MKRLGIRLGLRSPAALVLILAGVYLAVILLMSEPVPEYPLPLTAGGFVTSVDPARLPRQKDGPSTAQVLVTSDAARTGLVDVEIYDKSGKKLVQRVFDEQSFAAGEQHQYTLEWDALALDAKTQVVKVAVFSEGWDTLYHWNDRAAIYSR